MLSIVYFVVLTWTRVVCLLSPNVFTPVALGHWVYLSDKSQVFLLKLLRNTLNGELYQALQQGGNEPK